MSEETLKKTTELTLASAIGFAVSYFISNPKSKVKHKIPEKKIKSITVIPNVKFTRKDTQYHFHHWANYMTVYALLLLTKRKYVKNNFLKAFFLGTIIQGLTYKDRFKFRTQLQMISNNLEDER